MIESIPHKILMTADTVGGVWNYSLILTKALQAYGTDVHLATMGEPLNEDQWEEANKLENLHIYESNFALEWMEDPWSDVERAGKWLLELEQKINPDVIHLNNFTHSGLPWRKPVLTVGHSCVLSWWKAVHGEEIPLEWTEYAARVQENLQQSDIVVSVSRNMLDDLEHFYGPFHNARAIYNAREQDQFQPAKKKPQIFSMGRLWDEAKNIQALKEVAPSLEWPVFVAGDEGNDQHTKVKNIHALGQLAAPEVAEHLAESSIYVMPARYEPFGLSILEAALSGCALVLGDIPTLRELWEDAALFANPDDPTELKSQIQKLIEQPELREEMADKALERSNEFTLQKMSSSYMEAYKELLTSYSTKYFTGSLIKSVS